MPQETPAVWSRTISRWLYLHLSADLRFLSLYLVLEPTAVSCTTFETRTFGCAGRYHIMVTRYHEAQVGRSSAERDLPRDARDCRPGV